MPRYFFDIRDGTELIDHVGSELAGLDTAHVEAARLAGRLLMDNPDEFWRTAKWQVRVRSEDDTILFTLLLLAVAGPANNA
jgi:hypothetical protein